jgi:uncharacterized membrane protein YdbT with pleckstrin-like domain
VLHPAHYARLMGYTQKYFNEGEIMVLDLHPHWWTFVKPTFKLIGALALVVVSNRIATDTSSSFLTTLETVAVNASLALVGVTFIMLLIHTLQWSRVHFVVTNQRVIYRSGVIARNGIEIPVRKVNNVSFNQSFIERIVGAGDLLIESGGEDGQSLFSDIRDPEQVQNIIQRTLRRIDQDPHD